MRQWTPTPGHLGTAVLTDLVPALGRPDFAFHALQRLQDLVPAASCAVYRTGSRPELLMSAADGVADTTRDCWRAYLSGPHRHDRSLLPLEGAAQPDRPDRPDRPRVCHVVASEVQAEHRARVYEPHGMVERLSVVRPQPQHGLLAINLYRHQHQPAFRDAQLQAFGEVATALLALAEKQLVLMAQAAPAVAGARAVADVPSARQRLLAMCPALTARELDVCERVLRGMSHDGIAADLGLSLPTVKTYRNRAFQRLGIHFRSELYARMMPP